MSLRKLPELPFVKHKIIKILLGIFIISIVLWLLLLRLPRPLFPDDYSAVFTDRDGEILRVYLNDNQQWIFPPDTLRVPEKLEICILQFEDKRFYRHFGIDFIALGRAIFQNIRAGKYVSGASTITMQVARISGNRKRTIPNKIIEMCQAIRIERKYTKSEILRLYVQHAPYGGNIIGYEAASRRYFNKVPIQLTWAEAAMLAVLPNSPSLINPETGREKLIEKRNKLLDKVHEAGFINEENLRLSKMEDVPQSQIPFEIIAPHLCDRLAAKHGRSITSIDKEMQLSIQEICSEYSDYLQKFGIENIAAIVIDNKTNKVRAYIGSQDYFNQMHHGMVDGVMARRSYGSILKPFLYSLSMDEGWIIPETKLKDIPTFYGAFSPHNADESYRGLVSAKDALIQSLNVPAVRLLYTYGYPGFYDFLKQAGMTSLSEPASHYGLTIILGGAEANLFELSMLYNGLAHHGEFGRITVFEQDTIIEKQRLISRGSCQLVLDCMKDVRRPGAESYWNLYSDQWPIAWKTGTSYGHRDAWAIGCNPNWTIGVWVGNFSGLGNPAIMGSKTAGPVLFRIFNSLPKDKYDAWFASNDIDLKTIPICSETGYAIGSHCPDTAYAKAPMPGEFHARQLQRCPYHKKVFIAENDSHNGEKYIEQVCSRCWEIDEYWSENWLIYPPSVVQYLKKQGHSYRMLPKHRASCPVHHASRPMEFIYPTDGMVLLIPRDVSGQLQKIVARAAHNTRGSELFWHLDGKFIGSTIEGQEIQSHTIAIKLSTGTHDLSITDENGNTESISFGAQLRKN